MRKKTFTTVSLILFEGFASSQTISTNSLYIGETPPDSIPVFFASGKICCDIRSGLN